MKKHGLSLLAAILFVPLMPRVCQAQADIAPGRGVWKMRLGMSPQMLRGVVANPPDDTSRQRGGIICETWDPDMTVLLRGGRTIQISVSNLNESTPDGISCRATLAAVRAHYNALRHTRYAQYYSSGKLYGQSDIYDDVPRGIAFEFLTASNAKGRTEMENIIVHLPGHSFIPPDDYRPLPVQ